MNILIIHEVDWIKKTTYEMHHLSELFSLKGHNVYAIDIPDPTGDFLNFAIYKPVKNYHRVYDNSSVILFRTPSVPIKGLNRIISYISTYSFVKKILKKYDIDVVMLYSVVTNAKQALKACTEENVPVIHRTFDIIHDLIREDYLRKIVLKVEKSIYPKLKVITNTPFMKNWASEMGAIDVSIIPQGVDPNIMKPVPKNTELQKSLGITADDKVVMYLGTIESFSGLEVLIDAIPKILQQIPNFKLLIVGGGSHLENLKKRTQNLGLDSRVIFTGYKPYLEVPQYCSLASLCVNTFRINEMTNRLSPVKIFDLQACGKPILATPLEGLLLDFPEEKCGVIYCRLEEFADKLAELMTNESILLEIGNRGKKFITENFTWEKAAEKWINEFNKFVNL